MENVLSNHPNLSISTNENLIDISFVNSDGSKIEFKRGDSKNINVTVSESGIVSFTEIKTA